MTACYLPVVIEDDKVSHAEVSGTVHGLKRHAARDGAIADDSHAVVLPLLVAAKYNWSDNCVGHANVLMSNLSCKTSACGQKRPMIEVSCTGETTFD